MEYKAEKIKWQNIQVTKRAITKKYFILCLSKTQTNTKMLALEFGVKYEKSATYICQILGKRGKIILSRK